MDYNVIKTICSNEFKYELWKQLWATLAEAQSIQGINITNEQIKSMYVASVIPTTGTTVADHKIEFASHCQDAIDVIGLGASDAYVIDNAEILAVRLASEEVAQRLEYLIMQLAIAAEKHHHVLMLGSKGATTMGKLLSIWINDFDLAHDQLAFAHDQLALPGWKDDCGNQTTGMDLFDGDRAKTDAVDDFIGRKFGMDVLMIVGNTYSRIFDMSMANAIGMIAHTIIGFTMHLNAMTMSGEISANSSIYLHIYDMAKQVVGMWHSVMESSAKNVREFILPQMLCMTSDCIIGLQTIMDGFTVNDGVCGERLLQTDFQTPGFVFKQVLEYVESIYKKYDPD